MLRECLNCGREFDATSGGRARLTCSPVCRRARLRDQAHSYHERNGESYRDLGGAILIAPMLPWLRRRCAEHESTLDAAGSLEIGETTLRRWLNGERTLTSVDFADQLFCRVGEPYLLRELYPHLYDLEEVA